MDESVINGALLFCMYICLSLVPAQFGIGDSSSEYDTWIQGIISAGVSNKNLQSSIFCVRYSWLLANAYP